MNILKTLIVGTGLIAVSFSTLAYHGDGNCPWGRSGNQSQQQYNQQQYNQQRFNNRPCDNYRNFNYANRHHGMMQYSTSVQTTQPDEALKKIAADAPKGENGKQYMVKVAVIEVAPNAPAQN